MSFEETIEVFSKKFVRRDYRKRCVHEALRRPDRLMRRICHRPSGVFEGRFKNGHAQHEASDECYLFHLTGHVEETTWGEAMETIGNSGGGGYLIIEYGGDRFYAESEGEPPVEIYSSGGQ